MYLSTRTFDNQNASKQGQKHAIWNEMKKTLQFQFNLFAHNCIYIKQ